MKKRIVTAIVILGVSTVALSACGSDKFNEQFADAHRSGTNSSSAIVGTMPDGFNNWAFKCNGTDGVYTTFHSNAAYGGIAVVNNDPNCAHQVAETP